jgi:hypothetical protein
MTSDRNLYAPEDVEILLDPVTGNPFGYSVPRNTQVEIYGAVDRIAALTPGGIYAVQVADRQWSARDLERLCQAVQRAAQGLNIKLLILGPGMQLVNAPAAFCPACPHPLSEHDTDGRCHGIERKPIRSFGGEVGEITTDCTCMAGPR